MNLKQRISSSSSDLSLSDRPAPSELFAAGSRMWMHFRWRRMCAYGLMFFLQCIVLFCIAGSAVSPHYLKQQGMATIVAPWSFNLLNWEVDALWQKTRAFAMQPSYGLDYATSVSLVQQYLSRAQQMQVLEEELDRLIGTTETNTQQQDEVPTNAEIQRRQSELEDLRDEQDAVRSTVEQIIERQISTELRQEGLTRFGQPFPPVQFTFVEPPRKLVVSQRDRITTEYSQILEATMSLEEMRSAEDAYFQQYNSSAYITNIGGLGAFPTMVVDRASLEWILSTVAHEWVHNYLTLYPLGFNYMTNADFITMNETVAEIVGNELGAKALQTFYPDQIVLPPPTPSDDDASRESERLPLDEEPRFDFRQEMRETRLAVDKLLALGKVTEAETYMEERRLYFIENGYRLRVLNQAYFAFHGSYGTSAASTSPIGPQLEALRRQLPDLKTFLETVRSFTSPDDITDALMVSQ